MHPQNAEIPSLIAEGKADVMITETMEARRYVRDDARLAAPLLDEPFTKNHFGILLAKGDQDWLNYINFFMEERIWMARWISWKTNILNKAFYAAARRCGGFFACVTIYDDSDDILGGYFLEK